MDNVEQILWKKLYK